MDPHIGMTAEELAAAAVLKTGELDLANSIEDTRKKKPKKAPTKPVAAGVTPWNPAVGDAAAGAPAAKKKGGRPKGSKNKPKVDKVPATAAVVVAAGAGAGAVAVAVAAGLHLFTRAQSKRRHFTREER